MQKTSRRNLAAIIVVILILLALLFRCKQPKPAALKPTPPPASAVTAPAPVSAPPTVTAPAAPEPAEVLSPATLQVPPQVGAGKVFSVTWTGPANHGDYLTIVPKDARDGTYANFTETSGGNPVELTAPIEPGNCEVRYMTARTATVLGREPIAVQPLGATLAAADEAVLDTPLTITWTGPDNQRDYITIVAADETDGKYGNYTNTDKGSPLTITTPPTAGAAEIRYMTGQSGKVLARRPLRIIMPEVSLTAPDQATAGTVVLINWTGPANPGDYITVIAQDAPEGRYGNYTNVVQGTALKLTMLMDAGDHELRYMTGRGGKILARRPIQIVAAAITLSAPAEATVNAPISVTWTGPANEGDYITVVAQGTADGQYGAYTYLTKGSPLTVNAPKAAGPAEVRYMSGQGTRVLARRAITITP